MAKRTFEHWIDGIFDHPVIEPAWFWAPDADPCVEDDETNAVYLARLFMTSDQVLDRFDNAQVNQGLNMLVNCSCSNHAYTITQGSASWPTRQLAIRAIFDVYDKCFARRCTDGLSHCQGIANPLNYICYMWWDVLPAWADPKAIEQTNAVDEYMDVMERCLSLKNHACLEGALHGLGHWQLIAPERAEPIIKRFLHTRTDLRPELVLYAQHALTGEIQ